MKTILTISVFILFSFNLRNSFAQQNITAAYDSRQDISKTWREHNGFTGDYLILNQNVPNPFTDKTVITYYIPVYVENAAITVYDDMGTPVKTFRISVKGQGEVILYAGNLKHGLYTYNLIADGKIVASGKMVH